MKPDGRPGRNSQPEAPAVVPASGCSRPVATLAWIAAAIACSCGGASARSDAGRLEAAASISDGGGEACFTEGTLVCGQNAAGKADNTVVFCSAGFYQVVFRCPEGEACANIAGHDQVRCGGTTGTYFAQEGAACTNEANQACSFDQQSVLRCSAGTWLKAIHCSPSTCANLAPTGGGCVGTWCANCGYTPGDMCSFSAEKVECSTDLSKIVQCSDGTVAVWRDCGSGKCSRVQGDGAATLECQ